MYIIRNSAGQVRRVQSLHEAAQIVELDTHEIAWALEEHGRCETDTHSVEVDEHSTLAHAPGLCSLA